jgi:hypothetical protein
MKQWPGMLLLLLGVVVRIVVFFQNRSIHMDEANLARNILEKDMASFFQPLDYQQYAPPLFLVWEKRHVWLLGPTEYALRLFPLICGCLMLWFWWKTLKQLGTTHWIGLAGLWLLVFSPLHIRYATEIKQYATDSAVALALIWLALHYWPSIKSKGSTADLPASNRLSDRYVPWSLGALTGLALAGAAAIWLSMPAVFVLAGIGIAFAWIIFSGGHRKAWGPLFAVGAVWLMSFGSYYFLILQNDLTDEALSSYHQDYFWPLLPASSADWQQLGAIVWEILRNTFGFTVIAISIGGLLVVWGLVVQWQRSTAQGLLLGIPVVACILASGLGYYSLIPRLTLFFLPLLVLFFVIGLDAFSRKLNGYWKVLPFLLVLPLLPLQKGYEYLWGNTLEMSASRPLLRQLQQQYSPDQLLIVTDGARPAFHFYNQLHRDKGQYQFAQTYVTSWEEWPVHVLERTATHRGRWLLFAHLVSDEARALRAKWLEEAAKQGLEVKAELWAEGANAVLLE